jgi:hypothetical protein
MKSEDGMVWYGMVWYGMALCGMNETKFKQRDNESIKHKGSKYSESRERRSGLHSSLYKNLHRILLLRSISFFIFLFSNDVSVECTLLNNGN